MLWLVSQLIRGIHMYDSFCIDIFSLTLKAPLQEKLISSLCITNWNYMKEVINRISRSFCNIQNIWSKTLLIIIFRPKYFTMSVASLFISFVSNTLTV